MQFIGRQDFDGTWSQKQVNIYLNMLYSGLLLELQ